MHRLSARYLYAIVVVSAVVAIVLYARHVATHPPHSSNPNLEGNSSAGQTLWVTAHGFRLKTRVYRSARASDHPILVVVLHGDSPFSPPSYQYVFAREAAAQIENLTVAAILRPGYTDDTGDTSDGEHGHTTGDNYTPQVVDAVAGAAAQLEVRYASSRVIVVGHSGGATISADLIERDPDLADAALLVSCPCDVPAFRKHMAAKQFNPLWLAPTHSLSPLDRIDHVSASTIVRLLVGANDDVAPPVITKEYAAALRARHIDVGVTLVPGQGHDIFLEPVVLEALQALAATLEASPRSAIPRGR
ncbi:MAG: alpha/beta hydrolase [Vicinamibacterales bacterium]